MFLINLKSYFRESALSESAALMVSLFKVSAASTSCNIESAAAADSKESLCAFPALSVVQAAMENKVAIKL